MDAPAVLVPSRSLPLVGFCGASTLYVAAAVPSSGHSSLFVTDAGLILGVTGATPDPLSPGPADLAAALRGVDGLSATVRVVLEFLGDRTPVRAAEDTEWGETALAVVLIGGLLAGGLALCEAALLPGGVARARMMPSYGAAYAPLDVLPDLEAPLLDPELRSSPSRLLRRVGEAADLGYGFDLAALGVHGPTPVGRFHRVS